MTAADDANDELRELQRALDGEDVRDATRALLEPGEVLREFGDVDVAFGDTGPVSEWHESKLKPVPSLERVWAFGTSTTPRKVVFSTLLSPLLLYAAISSIGPPAVLDRLVGGRTCEGPRASVARRVQHALSPLGGRADTVVISDRRLLLANRALFASPPRFTLVSAVPLSEIAAARRRPRGLLRRRVELRFADGSRIVLGLPSLRSPRPARVVAALGFRGAHR